MRRLIGPRERLLGIYTEHQLRGDGAAMSAVYAERHPASPDGLPSLTSGRCEHTCVKRRLPRMRDVVRFLSPAAGTASDSKGLPGVWRVEDFERLARRRTPRAVFDYVAGAAEAEISMRRSVSAFRSVVFHPHVLRNVECVTTGTNILGVEASLPVVLGPTGFTRMMRAEGEPAVARAARRSGVPYTLSTLGTTSLERLAEQANGASLWFQLYLWKDRGRSRELIARARSAGYSTLVLTVDVPVAGARLRDRYNGLTMPPSLSGRTLLGMAARPKWLYDVLTTDPLSFESLGEPEDVMSLIDSVFDARITLDDIGWLRGLPRVWLTPDL